MFKQMLVAVAVSAMALGVHAQTDQQNKMKSCNVEAKGKKGDERKAFMKECLQSKQDARAGQREKMKSCNVEAQGKKGDERKAFMKSCLSK